MYLHLLFLVWNDHFNSKCSFSILLSSLYTKLSYEYCATLLGGDDDVAEKICQHIIGMKPMSIGKLEDLNKELSEKDAAQKVQAKSSENAENLNEDADDHTPQARPSKDNEHRLLMQDFVFDPDTTVGELLQEHGMQITRFYRFECAQEMIENKD